MSVTVTIQVCGPKARKIAETVAGFAIGITQQRPKALERVVINGKEAIDIEGLREHLDTQLKAIPGEGREALMAALKTLSQFKL